MPLTQRQQRLFEYLDAYIREHGYSPTYEEIATHFHYRSLATVSEHVRNLAGQGVIRVGYMRPRSIEVVKTVETDPSFPPVFPPLAWLGERCEEYTMCPLPVRGERSRGMIERYREGWREIRSRLLTGDELWTFRNPDSGRADSPARAGYAIVREGAVIDGLVTHDELSEPAAVRSDLGPR